MGIKNLLKYLKEKERRVHVSELKGKRVGIDAYCWLHRAVVTCAVDLATGTHTTKYIQYVVSRVQALARQGCTPIMVFDGAPVPLKSGTESTRAQRRQENMQRGMELYRGGDVSGASSFLEKGLNITTEMARSTIKALQDIGIVCIVAPYEADAQLAYLSKINFIDIVITEDSDLLVYGTHTVWYKLERDGFGIELTHESALAQLSSDIGVESVNPKQFQSVCVLAGCDYLSSLPGVGIKTAIKLIANNSTIDDVLKNMKADGKLNYGPAETASYAEGFERALYCFSHHLVFDPLRRCIVPYETFTDAESHHEDIIGHCVDDDLAHRMCALHIVDPMTKQPYKCDVGTRQRSMHEFGIKVTRIAPSSTPSLAMSSPSPTGKAPASATPLKDIIKRTHQDSQDSASKAVSTTPPTERKVLTRVVSRFFARQTSATSISSATSSVVVLDGEEHAKTACTDSNEIGNGILVVDDVVDSDATPPPTPGARQTAPAADMVRGSDQVIDLDDDDDVVGEDDDVKEVDGPVRDCSTRPTPRKQTRAVTSDVQHVIDTIAKRVKVDDTPEHHHRKVPVRSVADVQSFLAAHRFQR
eukprot:PhM_4_TR5337/c0_g1_i1/m.77799/K10746/EXO1; exonuclease 1